MTGTRAASRPDPRQSVRPQASEVEPALAAALPEMRPRHLRRPPDRMGRRWCADPVGTYLRLSPRSRRRSAVVLALSSCTRGHARHRDRDAAASRKVSSRSDGACCAVTGSACIFSCHTRSWKTPSSREASEDLARVARKARRARVTATAESGATATTRRLADAPVGGQSVTIRLAVRRFFCGTPDCPAVMFAEQADGLTSHRAWRTRPLAWTLTAALPSRPGWGAVGRDAGWSGYSGCVCAGWGVGGGRIGPGRYQHIR
jgi:hypothetical protein